MTKPLALLLVSIFVPILLLRPASGAELDQEPAPEPYSFSYSAQSVGGLSSHQESGDGSGRVSGFYTISGEDGRERRVDYVADENGYRASVKTNEIGTRAQSAADATYEVQLPTDKQLEAAKTSYENYKYLEETHAIERERNSARSGQRLARPIGRQQQQAGQFVLQPGSGQAELVGQQQFGSSQQRRESAAAAAAAADEQNFAKPPLGSAGQQGANWRQDQLAASSYAGQANRSSSAATQLGGKFAQEQAGATLALGSAGFFAGANSLGPQTMLQRQLEQQFMVQASQLANQDYPRQQAIAGQGQREEVGLVQVSGELGGQADERPRAPTPAVFSAQTGALSLELPQVPAVQQQQQQQRQVYASGESEMNANQLAAQTGNNATNGADYSGAYNSNEFSQQQSNIINELGDQTDGLAAEGDSRPGREQEPLRGEDRNASFVAAGEASASFGGPEPRPASGPSNLVAKLAEQSLASQRQKQQQREELAGGQDERGESLAAAIGATSASLAGAEQTPTGRPFPQPLGAVQKQGQERREELASSRAPERQEQGTLRPQLVQFEGQTESVPLQFQPSIARRPAAQEFKQTAGVQQLGLILRAPIRATEAPQTQTTTPAPATLAVTAREDTSAPRLWTKQQASASQPAITTTRRPAGLSALLAGDFGASVSTLRPQQQQLQSQLQQIQQQQRLATGTKGSSAARRIRVNSTGGEARVWAGEPSRVAELASFAGGQAQRESLEPARAPYAGGEPGQASEPSQRQRQQQQQQVEASYSAGGVEAPKQPQPVGAQQAAAAQRQQQQQQQSSSSAQPKGTKGGAGRSASARRQFWQSAPVQALTAPAGSSSSAVDYASSAAFGSRVDGSAAASQLGPFVNQ